MYYMYKYQLLVFIYKWNYVTTLNNINFNCIKVMEKNNISSDAKTNSTRKMLSSCEEGCFIKEEKVDRSLRDDSINYNNILWVIHVEVIPGGGKFWSLWLVRVSIDPCWWLSRWPNVSGDLSTRRENSSCCQLMIKADFVGLATTTILVKSLLSRRQCLVSPNWCRELWQTAQKMSLEDLVLDQLFFPIEKFYHKEDAFFR